MAADLRNSGSWKALAKLSRPTTLTANGVFRSRDRVSVKLMKSDWITGHTVKVRNSRQNGSARAQAARPSRRPDREAGLREGRAREGS